MSYIDESLSTDESVIGRFPLHWGAWLPVGAWLLLPLLLAPAGLAHSFGLSVLLLVGFSFPAAWTWLKLRHVEMGITNKRVIHKVGVVGRKTDEMKLSSIETVEIAQSLPGRLLGYGTVRVTGKGVSSVSFRSVADPMGVKRTIEGVSNPVE